ncbi:hypothetical protein RUM43_012712 [Polyplax serrata]|uniref:Uncharacterized protein n=1 Tax=Polyplax serrata TaxID=468196 RepID=A0AAN8S6G8_POLSC
MVMTRKKACRRREDPKNSCAVSLKGPSIKDGDKTSNKRLCRSPGNRRVLLGMKRQDSGRKTRGTQATDLTMNQNPSFRGLQFKSRADKNGVLCQNEIFPGRQEKEKETTADAEMGRFQFKNIAECTKRN